MEREERLEFCRICQNKEKSLNRGIICKLTGEQATFEDQCNSFVLDYNAKTEAEQLLRKRTTVNNTASSGKRFANYIIDRIAITVFGILISVIVLYIWGIIDPYALDSYLNSSDEIRIIDYLIGFCLAYSYYILFETLTGRSIGKFLTGTKVIDIDGNRPSFERIAKRSICRFIPFEAFTFLGENSEGMHDRLSNTRVVNIK